MTTSPSGQRHPFLDVDGPIAMAHRGFSLDGLENTMTAFAAAVDLGMTHVETDVHATRDGVLVAFHDARLERVTDGVGRISDVSWAELQSVRVNGIERIPRLDEVLSTWPNLRINIDIKDWLAIQPLVKVLSQSRALDRVCVTSFDDRRTAAARERLGPQLATSAGRREVITWRLASTLPIRLGIRYVGSRNPPTIAVQVPTTAGGVPIVTRKSVRMAHACQMQVHVWTVNDAAQMHRLLDRGVDGLISDRADILRGVLEQRRQGPTSSLPHDEGQHG